MAYKDLSPGKNPPEEINLLVEIARGGKIKYEFDIASGFMFVDRLMASPLMAYPGNYGFAVKTLGGDNDGIDGITWGIPAVKGTEDPSPVILRVRPVCVLIAEDEHGEDEKILFVPVGPEFDHIRDINDIPQDDRDIFESFFTHYKDFDKSGRWIRVKGWGDAAEARRLIMESIDRAKHPGMTYGPLGTPPKPAS